jgi:ADP-ribosyl-[dinitrogen reductase] hydrolase
MNPYAIDALPVAGGRIGLCCCPGHRLTPRFVSPSLVDLATDLDTIVAFGATHLVTLMEAGEMGQIGLDPERFGQAVAACGLEWLHLPIRNLSVPAPDWETGWAAAGAGLRRRLGSGGSFVMHCYAGLGRTGTVAARLLVESGSAPDDAIATVRATRPGSIETWEQETYVREQRWRVV